MITDKYLSYLRIERNASPHTLKSYETDLSDFRDFLERSEPKCVSHPELITRFTIRAWLGELSDRGMSKSSLARKVSTLRSFFRFASRRGHLEKNPAAQVQIPRKDKVLPKGLPESELEMLFDHMPDETAIDKRDRAIMELFYASGIRLSELTRLDITDIDFSARQITVMGKGAKQRIIPVSKPAQESLRIWLKARPDVLSAAIPPKDRKAVFLSARGKRIYPMAVQRLVRKSIERVSEASQKSPHVIRHSFATHLLNHGADIRVIKELMGHASLTATQVYTGVSVDRLKRIYENSHPRGKL